MSTTTTTTTTTATTTHDTDDSDDTNPYVSAVDDKTRFYYFCYGSNLLSKRIHVNNKSAVKYSNGILHGFRLTFSGYGIFWHGAVANIVPDSNSLVSGVIWSISENDLIKLDKQEIGYKRIVINVNVDKNNDNENNTVVKCLTYVQKEDTTKTTHKSPIDPLNAKSEQKQKQRIEKENQDNEENEEKEENESNYDLSRPSLTYKNIMIKGAIEHSLPTEYIEMLKNIPDNGFNNCELASLINDDDK